MDVKAYVLRAASPPWGDYGRILVNGMSRHLPRREGRIQLERTGPFVPPITFPGPGDVVVTDAFRHHLERERFSGLQFAPLHLAHIVRLEWEQWDRQAEKPFRFPAEGRPEGYVLDTPHDPSAARELDELWECLAAKWGVARTEGAISRRPLRYHVILTPGTEPMPDFFKAEGVRYLFVSERARTWLQKQSVSGLSSSLRGQASIEWSRPSGCRWIGPMRWTPSCVVMGRDAL
jgi:hypothetical protein